MTTEIINKELDTTLDPETANFDLNNYFAVRGWLWDPKEEDHSAEIGQGKGIKRFKDGAEALDYFEKVKYGAFFADDKGDIKLEFIHFRFGVPRVLRCRILFA